MKAYESGGFDRDAFKVWLDGVEELEGGGGLKPQVCTARLEPSEGKWGTPPFMRKGTKGSPPEVLATF